MNDTAIGREDSWFSWGDRDCWPFVRILIVATVLLSAAHCRLGWKLDTSRLLAMPGQVLGVLSILAMISFALAELYLLLFAIPLYVLGVLNDWFYDLSWGLCRVLLRMRPGPLLALAGLSGEIALFGGLGLLIRRLLIGL